MIVFLPMIGLCIATCDTLGMASAVEWATGKPHRPAFALLAGIFWLLGAVAVVVGVFVSATRGDLP